MEVMEDAPPVMQVRGNNTNVISKRAESNTNIPVNQSAKQEIHDNGKDERRQGATLTDTTFSEETRREMGAHANALPVPSVEGPDNTHDVVMQAQSFQHCPHVVMSDARESSLEVKENHTSSLM